MTSQEVQNIAWLTMAVSLPTGYTGESCYYDKRSKQFFILTSLDHILIDDRLKPFWINGYTEEQEAFLIDKLMSIDSGSHDIISIHKIEIDIRIDIQTSFIAELPSIEYHNDLMSAVAMQDYTTSFVLNSYLNDHTELNYFLNEWQSYLDNALVTYAKQIAALNEIDLSGIELYHIDPACRAMTKIGTPEPLQVAKDVAKRKKRTWWKWW